MTTKTLQKIGQKQKKLYPAQKQRLKTNNIIDNIL